MSARLRIDLNADVGESLGPWPMGDDAGLIPLVSSVNVACGAHAGDPLGIERTIRLAIDAGAAVGAHPGYPDLVGFGRREMDVPADELEASIVFQVSAVAGMARSLGAALRHVKPHGALYNRAARDPAVAAVIARAVRRVSSTLVMIGLAGSCLLDEARAAGLPVAAEAFVDRAYEPDGSLRSRRLADSVIADPDVAAARAVGIVRGGSVGAVDGTRVRVAADTLCIHGDTPGAARIAATVRSALEAAGIEVAPLTTGSGRA